MRGPRITLEGESAQIPGAAVGTSRELIQPVSHLLALKTSENAIQSQTECRLDLVQENHDCLGAEKVQAHDRGHVVDLGKSGA